mgnify:CR=1 FL=1
MSTITTTLVSGQNAYVGAVTSRSPLTVTVSSGLPGAPGATGANGANGTPGSNGISVVSSNIVNGFLSFTLSNSAVINAGSVSAVSGSLTNGSFTVLLQNTGTVVLPGNNSLVYSESGIDITAANGGWAELQSNNLNNYVWVDNNNAYIGTNWSVTPYQWTFGANGSLGLPGGGTLTNFTNDGVYLYSNTNGTEIGYVNGNVTCLVGGEVTDAYLYAESATTETFSSVSAGSNGTVSIRSVGDQGAKWWYFDVDGTLKFPDDTTQNTAFSSSRSYTWSNVQTFSNTVNFNGDINVNGNVNYFTSNNIVYTDALVEVHAPGGNTSNTWSTNDGSDIGFRFHYYNGADKNAGLFMDNGTWRLKWVVDGTESAGQFSHTGSLGDFEANTIYANVVATSIKVGNTTNYMAVNSSMFTANLATGYNNPTFFAPYEGDTWWAYGAFSNTTDVWLQGRVWGDGTSQKGFRILDAATSTIIFSVDTTGTGYVNGSRIITSASLASNVAVLASNNANHLGGVAAASYLVTNTAINTGNVVVTGNITLTGNVTGNTAGVAIGYRDIPQLLANTNTTIANTDMGKHYYSANSTSMTLTIANNTSVAGIPVGAAISVVSYGTGNVVITRGTGVSLYLAANSTSADRTLSSYGMATIMKVATDTWVINGTGLT